MPLPEINKAIEELIERALREDIGDGDHSSLSCIPKNAKSKAQLIAKDYGVLAGVEVALQIFRKVDSTLQTEVRLQDGTPIEPGQVVLYVEGSAQAILSAERLVLNCMQRMSGIATYTAFLCTLIKGTGAKLLDTRKTSPGLRALEKAAVKIGGGHNHRMGLYDMIMLKDNHIDFAGGVEKAIESANQYLEETGKKLPIEVEVRSLDELDRALAIGQVQRIMLDNFNFEDLRVAVKRINGRFQTEASGGITEETIRQYAECGVDYISVGALTHSVKSLDLSLKAISS
ncbi:MAG: carboxylating nicotinate-nucleotide diphosphorylase [Cryomorphaceae bacterium]|nr:MAG: carboxylating nicotinate-nucleotide diphosphorylase [Cryomorphaceae bacterium]